MFRHLQTYFMEDGQGYIKIGSTSAPERRLRELRRGWNGSDKLRYLVRVDGNFEKEYHRLFEGDRVDGTRDWFKRSAAMDAFMLALPNNRELPFLEQEQR